MNIFFHNERGIGVDSRDGERQLHKYLFILMEKPKPSRDLKKKDTKPQ